MKNHHEMRAWEKNDKCFYYHSLFLGCWMPIDGFGDPDSWFTMKPELEDDFIIELCYGVEDSNGILFYENDIGEFENGDKFILKTEPERLEFYIEWIGEPECEDQARDLYRIGRSKIIGTTHQNSELLEAK